MSAEMTQVVIYEQDINKTNDSSRCGVVAVDATISDSLYK